MDTIRCDINVDKYIRTILTNVLGSLARVIPSLDGRMDGWKYGWMFVWMDVWVDGLMYGCNGMDVYGWMYGWMDVWMDGSLRYFSFVYPLTSTRMNFSARAK